MRAYELFESRPTSPLLMYHGTTDLYLKSILKNGLLKNPPQRGYGNAQPGNETFPGAVYLTANRKLAREAALDMVWERGGNPLIITVASHTTAGTIDEDTIFQSIVNRAVADAVYDNQQPPVDQNKIRFFIQSLKMELDITSITRFTNKSLELLSKIYTYIIETVNQLKSEYKNTTHIIVSMLSDRLMTDQPLRAMVRELIDTLKVYNPEETSVRIRQTVGFKGRTRIVRIDRLIKDLESDDYIRRQVYP
jgi:hypothetical protein